MIPVEVAFVFTPVIRHFVIKGSTTIKAAILRAVLEVVMAFVPLMMLRALFLMVRRRSVFGTPAIIVVAFAIAAAFFTVLYMTTSIRYETAVVFLPHVWFSRLLAIVTFIGVMAFTILMLSKMRIDVTSSPTEISFPAVVTPTTVMITRLSMMRLLSISHLVVMVRLLVIIPTVAAPSSWFIRILPSHEEVTSASPRRPLIALVKRASTIV